MADIGNGYGSECHLLRYLGRHRRLLDQQVIGAIGRGDRVDWLDFEFDPKRDVWQDAELKGLSFLPSNRQVQAAWEAFWPQGRGIMNWDAVGWLHGGGPPELLLVEAKGNLQEIKSDCGAVSPTSRSMIEASLGRVKTSLRVPAGADWLNGYYQFSNRIAVTWFLVQHGIPVNLLMIYFTGDKGGSGRTCPSKASEWQQALADQDRALKLPDLHPLADRVHKLFLPVAG